MSRPSFLALPHELRELVAGDLDHPADLRALALTCRALYLLLVPAFLDYCAIRPFIHAPDLWHHLAAAPLLAAHVKHLLLCRRDYRLPRGFHPDDHVTRRSQQVYREGVLQLARALRNMSALLSFQFPPGIRGKNDEIWEALAESCPNLRELVLWDSSPYDFEHRPLYESKVFDLQDLSVFKLYEAAYAGSIIPPPTARLRHFLLNSPHLEELLLHFHFVDRRIAAPLDALFASAHWPRLRALELSSVSCRAETAAPFFRRHPAIEKISLFDDFYDRVDLALVEPGTLPRLRVFYGTVASLKALARARAPLQDVTLRWVLLNQEIVLALMRKFDAIKAGAREDDAEGWMVGIFEAVPRVILTDGSARVKAKMAEGKMSFQWESI
ncbi:hypothetical protein GLOTRDRAFT_135508 [Gloeophyllum trabeum ATCC 11539]|uniref:F-box domain-containing protein n=1 Tax=Gloeophyllum trabeum (strain ATCC 11539 / FP-39264 / Madison 617) TaxID=670483 RepID=S7S4Q7_GLOTA|nr:uncharacterized protein GLOTRDRAFT_135508 [Gloeophyllum trabeum ATCC 11539]EPQ60909.1 hypothetical protein GLOTRDRAFT_135508 [Gloeophyllum trabeum ATCC 11539]